MATKHQPNFERTKLFSRIVCLASAGLWIATAAVAQEKNSIQGAIVDDGPVTDARIILQSLRDERCVKLFNSHKQDGKSARRLEECMQDVATTAPDSHGQFQFSQVKPGWYDISALWNIRHKPERPTAFKVGDVGVVFPGWKDSTGKYDAYANDSAFYYSGQQDIVRNLDLTQRK